VANGKHHLKIGIKPYFSQTTMRQHCLTPNKSSKGFNQLYRIRGNFGGDLNLATWQILDHTAKLKSHQYNWSFVIINDVYW